MITYIVGELTYIDNNTIILEACGVGYEITVPESVIPSLPGIGSSIKIYTYQNVKEDALDLYGFLTMDDHSFLLLTDLGQETAKKIYERHCFFTEQLIAAGIDPKTAEADACRIEHIISDESFDRLKEADAQKQE